MCERRRLTYNCSSNATYPAQQSPEFANGYPDAAAFRVQDRKQRKAADSYGDLLFRANARRLVPLLIVLTDEDQLPPDIWPQVHLAARRSNRTLVAIANLPGTDQLGWVDFLESFGGAVPSWRALDDSYLNKLEIAAKNANPEGFDGEAWRLFESLVADGLEFCFGRLVRRLGAAKRGQRVSDMIAQIPDGSVLVLDAKATSTSFNAAISELRALAEYTESERIRQRDRS